MARVKRGVTSHARHKKVLQAAKGYRGRRHKTYKTALQAVERGWQYAYRDRRIRKRQFRALWIQRINAAARQHGMTYGRFMAGLREQRIDLNRKTLSEIAIHHAADFETLVARVRPPDLAASAASADATGQPTGQPGQLDPLSLNPGARPEEA